MSLMWPWYGNFSIVIGINVGIKNSSDAYIFMVSSRMYIILS